MKRSPPPMKCSPSSHAVLPLLPRSAPPSSYPFPPFLFLPPFSSELPHPHSNAPPSIFSCSRLNSLTKKNSFWIHRVDCLGTEPHLAKCQVQVAPGRGKLRPACPGGMHAVVSCVAGPHFRRQKPKPTRKESHAEVSPQGPDQSAGADPAQQCPAQWGRGERSHKGGEELDSLGSFFFFKGGHLSSSHRWKVDIICHG